MNNTKKNPAASVITYVSSLENAPNVFSNYMQQEFSNKELILVHNNPGEDFEQWLFLTRQYPMVRIYHQDSGASLGKCLNYCIERAIFENIAIFHEKHVYKRGYMSFSLDQMNLKNADLIGKKTYIEANNQTNQQNLLNPGFENCYTDMVILPTFFFKQSVFNIAKFDNSSENLDIKFCEKCRNNGIKIYSTGSAHFIFCL